MKIVEMKLVLRSLKEKGKTFKIIDGLGNLLFVGTKKECEEYFLNKGKELSRV